ncbi:type IV pilus modification PilV family protein [Photobacterium swingsii]|uniref:type IV pilus modification PilV family protein n=1 Tax=Photobacterium swingsii TaxID=680026 RepID=UPI004068A015
MRAHNLVTKQKGFTLIEGVITIVILGIAMVTMTSFIFPQVERSATPHYQARAAAISNAFLNEILSRKFDHHSEPVRDVHLRCGESGIICTEPDVVTGRWPEDDPLEYTDILDGNGNVIGKRLNVEFADDVDDFHGCWGDAKLCRQRYSSTNYPWQGLIENLLDPSRTPDEDVGYNNMTLRVDVSYGSPSTGAEDPTQRSYKRVAIKVDTGRYGLYDFVAYRGNY